MRAILLSLGALLTVAALWLAQRPLAVAAASPTPGLEPAPEPAPPGQPLSVRGAAEPDTPGWTLQSLAPAGWGGNDDKVARWIGVPLALHQGAWDGKPERVIVLNVWARSLPDLNAELAAERSRIQGRDPGVRLAELALPPVDGVDCRGLLARGADGIDDQLVFCQPQAPTDMRFSWSMAVAAHDPQRQALRAALMRVVGSTRFHADVAGR